MNLTKLTNVLPVANPLIFLNAVWMEKHKPAPPRVIVGEPKLLNNTELQAAGNGSC